MQLMKQQIDRLVASDPYLQEFLTWASEKSKHEMSPPLVATSRAFYLALARTPHLASDFTLASTLDQGMFLDAALDDLLLECAVDRSQDFAHAYVCGEALNNIMVMVLDAGLYKSLEQLKDEFPNSHQNQERFQLWWQTNYSAWAQQLHKTIANYRNIHHHWNFSPQQQKYCNATTMPISCCLIA
jgi:predicted NACHT family NTPase